MQYTLTGETFPVYDTELEYAQDDSQYGLTKTITTTDDQDFTQVINLDVPAGLLNRWDAAWRVNSKTEVEQGDKLLWVLYMRHKPVDDASVTGRVGIVAERNDTYDKEFDQIVDVTQNWQLYYIPMEISTRTHPVDGLGFGLQVGAKEQQIQIGGLAILNYGQDTPLEQLPRQPEHRQLRRQRRGCGLARPGGRAHR